MSHCFAPLFTYKVLKHELDESWKKKCFAPLFTYKVLKPISSNAKALIALHLYLLTRFSNCSDRMGGWYVLCTFIYLQGSQTALQLSALMAWALHLYLLTRFSNTPAVEARCQAALHLYLLTRLSNLSSILRRAGLALHLYLLTRFSNRYFFILKTL